MSNESIKVGYIGISIGSISLLLALVHFWAGPFSPQQPLEISIAEKAVAIRDATVSALKGEELEKKSVHQDFDTDRVVALVTVVLGGIAIIIGVVAYVRNEGRRVSTGAAVLGSIGIGIQYFSYALGAIIFAIILAAVLSKLDFDFF